MNVTPEIPELRFELAAALSAAATEVADDLVAYTTGGNGMKGGGSGLGRAVLRELVELVILLDEPPPLVELLDEFPPEASP